jgi:hypothetical protein
VNLALMSVNLNKRNYAERAVGRTHEQKVQNATARDGLLGADPGPFVKSPFVVFHTFPVRKLQSQVDEVYLSCTKYICQCQRREN